MAAPLAEGVGPLQFIRAPLDGQPEQLLRRTQPDYADQVGKVYESAQISICLLISKACVAVVIEETGLIDSDYYTYATTPLNATVTA